ncbi:MAG: hypothetical protein ABT15_05140 [Pseudonocardia sp. SCN 73-27]|uniref:acyl-CoA dehydrogenase family protein n=1 Tax=Pseudonocardia sp. SCN 73-27 TaxID=1660132 RepID=UPI00086A3670|nr:acyl-CoA dehydrogenase family protein [Pseudonocardia sp. SCN 73-27]ODV08078.1 MAG: hypothetical protein ABT15_05140 [Pseudonocardia sp. SCN 73-27]
MSDVATVVREVLAGAADEEAGWAQLSELGLTTVGVPEERGGSGGDLADLAEVVGAVAESGWDLPVAAHAVAAWAGGVLPVRGAVVLSGAGAPPPRVTGPVSHVVVAPLDGGPARLVVLDDGATVGAAGVEQEIGLAGAAVCGPRNGGRRAPRRAAGRGDHRCGPRRLPADA